MKKLVLTLALSVFAVSSAAAAYACDGMKGHEKTSDTQAKAGKDSKKTDATKADQKS